MAPNQPKMMLGWILKLCLVVLLSNPSGVLGYSTNLRGAVKTTEAAEAADADADAVVVDSVSFEEVPEMEEVELSEEDEEDEDEDEALEEQEEEWEDEDEDEDFEKYILEDEDLSEEELMELREQRRLDPYYYSAPANPFGYYYNRYPTYSYSGWNYNGPVTYNAINYRNPYTTGYRYNWYASSYLNDNNFYGYYRPYSYGGYRYNYRGYWNDPW